MRAEWTPNLSIIDSGMGFTRLIRSRIMEPPFKGGIGIRLNAASLLATKPKVTAKDFADTNS